MNLPPISTVDNKLITFFRTLSSPMARIALFVVFFWFGILKVFGHSPASPLVSELLERTLPFMTFSTFMVLFGLYEMLIGILFLLPKTDRLVMPLLGFHMLTTFMPLALLPSTTWSAPFIPTIEGQYIIKNILIIALAIGIAANVKPLKQTQQSTR